MKSFSNLSLADKIKQGPTVTYRTNGHTKHEWCKKLGYYPNH